MYFILILDNNLYVEYKINVSKSMKQKRETPEIEGYVSSEGPKPPLEVEIS